MESTGNYSGMTIIFGNIDIGHDVVLEFLSYLVSVRQ